MTSSAPCQRCVEGRGKVRSADPKEVDDGIVHCASRCDTSSPMSCGPAACRVKAPVGRLVLTRASRPLKRPLQKWSQDTNTAVTMIILAGKSQQNIRKIASLLGACHCAPRSGAGWAFGGVALGSPDDHTSVARG